MDNLERDLEKFLHQDVKSTETKLQHIKLHFEKQTFNSQQRDEYIESIFNKEYGLPIFIHKKLSNSKYIIANNVALEIIYTIMNNFPFKTDKYTEDLIALCKKIFHCYKLNYNTYCKSFHIIQKLILRNNAKNYVKDLYDKLYAKMNCLQMSMHATKDYYVTMGMIINKHYTIVQQDESILKMLIYKLSKASDKKEYVIVDGIICCISDCLIHMPSNSEDTSMNQIYQLLKKLLEVKDTRDKTFQRSLFALMQTHMAIFGKCMLGEKKYWHEIFNKWFIYSGDNIKAVFNMGLSFFEFLSSYNTTNAIQANYEEAVKFYINYYAEFVYSNHIVGFQRHLAIRVYGLLAKPYFRLLDSETAFCNFYLKFFNHIKENYYGNEICFNEFIYLQSFLQSFSEIICIDIKLLNENVDFLLSLMILLIRYFPKINENQDCSAVNSVSLALYNIYKVNVAKYNSVLKSMVYEGVQWTCSHSIDGVNVEEDGITYKDYLPFWKGLLNTDKLILAKSDEESCKKLYSDTCRELIYTMLKLIYKLNLRTLCKEVEDFSQLNIEAEQQYDFNIFVNIIDFYSDILSSWDKTEIRQYILNIIKYMIKLSVTYPLVIGFYKLLTVCLRIACETDYFSSRRIEQRQDLRTTCELLSSFTYDLLLQMKEYGENLQIACLEFIISLPTCVIKEHLPNVTTQIIIILKLGQGHLNIVEMTIDTLERLYNNFPESEIDTYLRKILPHLDPYLRSKSLLENNNNSAIKVNRKTITSLKKRQIVIEANPELYKLQRKILHFLGTLSSKLCIAFVEDSTNVKPTLWSKSSYLKVNLPVGEKNVTLILDKLLPTIIYLAQHCSDRKTRFAASELLHSIATILLDKNISEHEDGKLLLENVFSTVLLMCCDIDQEFGKIFLCLFTQMIHWYAKRNSNKTEVCILLDTLMNGVTNESNSSLRTYSGECLGEFIVWTKRQKQVNTDLGEDPNIKYIIEKIEQFNMHSDIYKRLGSAIIFNNIYKILREDDELINKYWIKLLYVFVNSLTIEDTSNDDKYLQQLTFVFEHLQRVFVHPSKRAFFNEPNINRIAPPAFRGNTLNDVAVWLFERFTISNLCCRDKCLKLFDAITPFIYNYKDLETFLQDNNVNFILKESPGRDDLFSSLRNTSCIFENNHDLLQWLKIFRKAIDFYCFASKKLLAFTVREEFLNAFAVFMEILTKRRPHLLNIIQERKNLDNFQFSTVMSILKLSAAFLASKHIQNVNRYFGETYCKFLTYCILRTENVVAAYDLDQFIDTLTKLLEEHKKYTNDDFKKGFLKEMDLYNIHEELTKNVDSHSSSKNVQILKGIIFMQKTILDDFVKVNLHFEEVLNASKNEKSVECTNLKLKIALKNYTNVFEVVDTLMGKSAKYPDANVNDLIKFRKYQSGLMDFLLANFGDIFSYLIEKYDNFLKDIVMYTNEIMEYLSVNLDQFDENLIKSIVQSLINCWPKIIPYFKTNSLQLNEGIHLLRSATKLTKKNGDELNYVSNWILSCVHIEQINMEVFLTFISDLFELFPYMIRPQDETEELKAYELIKSKILSQNFDENRATFIKVFLQNMIKILHMRPSLNYLKLAIETFVKTVYNAADLNLENALKSYVDNIDGENDQIRMLDLAYEMCNDRANFTNEERYNLGKNVLVHLLRSSSLPTTEIFYRKIIGQIYDSIKDEFVISDDDKAVTIILSLIIVENLFFDYDYESHSFITKEFKMTCLKRCFKVDEESLKLTHLNSEYLRLYNCHAYNALASIICNRQKPKTDGQYYVLLPYRSNWSLKLPNDMYAIDYDHSSVSSYKQNLTSIREDIKNQRKTINPSFKTPMYMESLSLLKSSLKGSFPKYDFSHANLRQSLNSNSNNDNNLRSEICLNKDVINNHECMSTCCAVIKQMFDEEEDKTSVQALPLWVENIRQILIRNTQSINTKVFFAKLIYNMRYIFKIYANWLMEPIINVILNCTGNQITSLTAELVLMIASWQILDLSRYKIVENLINFLVVNVDNKNEVLLRNNISMIKTMLELCNGHVSISYNNIEKHLHTKTGIIICNMALVNNIALWNNKDDVTSFTKKLVSCMSTRNLQLPLAECFGNYLNFLVSKNCMDFEENYAESIESELNAKISKCSMGEQVKLVVKVSVGYPAIARRYAHFIMQVLNIKCVNKREILSIFINAPNALKDSSYFNNFVNDIDTLLEGNAVDIKFDILKLLKLTTINLDIKKISLIVNYLEKHYVSFNEVCRNEMYEIFVNAYNQCKNNEDATCKDIIRKCRTVMLLSLAENNQEFEERFLILWQDILNLNDKNISGAFIYLLENLYFPRIEDKYLSYFSYFFLNALRSSANLDDYLIKKYHDDNDNSKILQVNESYKNRLSNNRMFGNTLTFKKTEFGETLPQIEATQVLQFTSTINPGQVVKGVENPHKNVKSASYASVSNLERYTQFRRPTKHLMKYHSESVKEKESNIKVYRNYRAGEMPDFSITFTSLIELMQVLSLKDAQFAGMIFRNVFDNFLTDDNTEYANDILKQMNKNLVASTLFVPSFIETYLTIALMHKQKFDVKLGPDVISRTCLNSGLLSTGALLFEQYILDEYMDEIPSKKSKLENICDNYWIKLAQIYREMNEWDVVSSIFRHQINCGETRMLAIEAEANGHWRQAKGYYGEALRSSTLSESEELCYESYFKCLAYLSEWEDLSTVIKQSLPDHDETSGWKSLLLTEYNKDIFRWYITAEIKNNLCHGNKKAKMLQEINCILKDEELTEYFKYEFGEEIAFLMLTENDADLSKIYINKCITNFLSNWSHINPLLVTLRCKKLLQIQLITDMENLLIQEDYQRKIGHWKITSLDNVSNIIDVEKRCFYRQEMLNYLRKNGSTNNHDVFKLKILLDKSLIKTALKKSNYHIAEKTRFRLIDQIKHFAEEDLELHYLSNQIVYLKFKLSSSIDLDYKRCCLKEMLKTYNDKLNVPDMKNDLELMLSIGNHFFDITSDIMQLNSKVFSKIDSNDMGIFQKAFIMDEFNLEDIQILGANNLKNCVDYCRNELNNLMADNQTNITKYLSKSLYRLALYAKGQIEKDNDKSHNKMFVDYTLLSMYYGSAEGRQLFPCILNIENLQEYEDSFRAEYAKNLPTWMFLKWLPQLMSNLNANKSSLIENILIKIAETYPQAIMHHYRLFRAKSKTTDQEQDSTISILIQKLDHLLLSNPTINKLLKALSSVALPDNVLEYNINKLTASIDKNFEQVLEQVINELFTVTDDCKDFYKIRGDIWLNFIQLEADFRSLLCNSSNLKSKLNEMNGRMRKSGHNNNKLMSYSPWLANVHDLQDVEVPGQYTGDNMPLVQYHAKIYSFSPWVEVYRSKCSPIKVRINSHDGKEYNFLIKYGEDLRQDQRIEQLFGVINNIFRNDADCEYRQLSTRTYEVIPLTEKFGMIQYMKNTKQLRTFLCENIKKETLIYVRAEYEEWMKKQLPYGELDWKKYSYSCLKYDSKVTTEKMAKLTKYIPADSFSKAFWKISKDTASFVALRRKFVTSYAVQCVCNWILGIGDRHLDNTLFCMDNGESISIDFGHAFGVATQFQIVPELVPIRLTKQFLNLMEPLNENGYFEKTMFYALKALRNNNYILLATMDVFIKEPTLNWLEHVRVIDDNGPNSNQWSPTTKIQQAREKLNGMSSVEIMIQDIKLRNCDELKINDKYIELVEANLQRSLTSHLEVSEQVKYLIKHATDSNLLGRMYAGWEPWL